ncbi:hypothetical protein BT69DRAFT_1283672 [Atractiella rhizophila]|nr:hypothetical protein BT69DRAFT_1283672 [Atractiella rhizophila]
MVCAKCEKKLAKAPGSTLACTDVWTAGSSSSRKLNENKLLSSRAKYAAFIPSQNRASSSSSSGIGPSRTEKGKGRAAISGSMAGSVVALGKCEKCKSTVAKAGAKFCQGCAYKGGVCAMCGKQVLDTTMYKQTSK